MRFVPPCQDSGPGDTQPLDLVHYLIYFLVMNKVNIHDAKTNFSRYLAEVEKGETLIVCRRNIPIAEIRPLRKEGKKKRPIGLAKGEFEVPPEFFDPLPDDMLAAFEGKGGDDYL